MSNTLLFLTTALTHPAFAIPVPDLIVGSVSGLPQLLTFLSSVSPIALNDEPAGRPIPQDPDAALYETEAAHLAGPSVRTLQALRLRGGGPVFFYAGSKRAVRYRRRDVLEWIEQRIRRSTSDPGPVAAIALIFYVFMRAVSGQA